MKPLFGHPVSKYRLRPCILVQVNLDMTDSMGPGKLVHHMQNPSYTYDTYLICMGLGASISSVIGKNLSYSVPSYPSSPVYAYFEQAKNYVGYAKIINCLTDMVS